MTGYVSGKHYCYRTITIDASETTSSVADMEDYTIVGIEMPATLTGTQITFNGGGKSDALVAIKNANDAVVFVAATGGARRVALLYDNFLSVRYVNVTSNDTEAATRTFTLIGYKP